MLRYFKAQASSLTATAVDFLVTLLVANFFSSRYLTASIIGTVCGGMVNFYINRFWVFDAASKALKWQALKYILVWVGNLILVTLGVYFFTHFFNINYMLSKVFVSISVGISYNYYMQKLFIFSVK
ncbi:GtrA family protein [Pedobacter aquatilis]|uniref:GtrA family protein n=1 Tax=Pedobacter aquatilis TaxID=351343 RepID=UPI00292F7415|nr:GtrA family protein [Pedobacter aquatilis]